MEILHAHPLPDDVRAGWRHFPIAANVPLADVARTGEPVFLESRDAWVARYPALAPLVDALGHQANMVVPLVVGIPRGHEPRVDVTVSDELAAAEALVTPQMRTRKCVTWSVKPIPPSLRAPIARSCSRDTDAAG